MDEAFSIPQQAVNNFMAGYNCAQAVFCAFAQRMGLDQDQAARLASALGGGLCRMRETCGAVSGAMLALGALKGYDDPEDQAAKQFLYARGQRVMLAFKEKYGSLSCRDLLRLPPDTEVSPMPTPRTAEFYQSRPCARVIYEIARLLEEELARP